MHIQGESVGTMVAVQKLFEFFTYDAEEGVVRWRDHSTRAKKSGHSSSGRVPGGGAGAFNRKGYIKITIPTGETLTAHRIAWAMHYGKWPKLAIDHMNAIKHDNRISNLREVTACENNQNRHAMMPNNQLGVLGVKRVGSKFRADFQVNGRCIYLGLHPTAQVAHDAYLQAKRKYHPSFTG